MIDLSGYRRCLASIPLVREVEATRAALRFRRQMEAIRAVLPFDRMPSVRADTACSGEVVKGAAAKVAKFSEFEGVCTPPTPLGGVGVVEPRARGNRLKRWGG